MCFQFGYLVILDVVNRACFANVLVEQRSRLFDVLLTHRKYLNHNSFHPRVFLASTTCLLCKFGGEFGVPSARIADEHTVQLRPYMINAFMDQASKEGINSWRCRQNYFNKIKNTPFVKKRYKKNQTST